MRVGTFLASLVLLPTAALATTTFETFNPLLRYKQPTLKAKSREQPPLAKRQTQSSPFLNSNTTSEFHPQCVHFITREAIYLPTSVPR